MDFQDVYERCRPELLEVERVLRDSVQSRNLRLLHATTQLLEAGGKRIRPLYAILSSRFGTGDRSKVYALAAALELVHMASLVHDDVIDDASLRRGKPTVRAQFGNRAAMYTGDFLFARAIQRLSELGSPLIHEEMSSAIARMCEGEIEQIRDFFSWQQTLRNYLRRVERKTALLISISCALGARAAEAPGTTVEILRRFGYYTGMAFQITDDILDYVGDEKIVGKPVGGDLRQGNLTLPALRAAYISPRSRELQESVLEGMQGGSVARAIDIVRASDGLEYARQLATRYLTKAMTELEKLAPGPDRDGLAIVARFVNQRSH